MKYPKFPIFARSKKFSAADIADSASLKAALTAAMLLTRDDANKVFPFPVMRKIADGTAEPKKETLDDGYMEILNESLPMYTLESVTGVCQQQAMIDFNGWTDTVYIIDKDGIFWGVATDDGGCQGFSVGSLYTNPPRFGNSANIATSKTELLFGSVDEFKNKLVAIKVDFDPTKLANIVDVTLAESAAASGYVFKIKGTQSCAGNDIYAAYKLALAQTGAWKATNLTDGSSITVSSITADDATSSWFITLNNSPVIAPATKIKLEFVSPAAGALLSTPLKGIEAFSLIVTKP